MDETLKKLVDESEDRATVKPRTRFGGSSFIGYSTINEACEDVVDLCAAVRKLDAKHAEERAAWVEYITATVHFDDLGKDNFLEEAVRVREDARLKLVALGVPEEMFL
jgi:hypothetical protein